MPEELRAEAMQLRSTTNVGANFNFRFLQNNPDLMMLEDDNQDDQAIQEVMDDLPNLRAHILNESTLPTRFLNPRIKKTASKPKKK